MTCMTQAKFDSLSAEAKARYLASRPEPNPGRIDAAIDSYAARCGGTEASAPPYDRASLAEIYAPRVQQLLALQSEFRFAEWRWDAEAAENRWHGVGDPAETETP